MSVISIRVNDDEKKILDSASKAYGCKVYSMIKKSQTSLLNTPIMKKVLIFFERLF